MVKESDLGKWLADLRQKRGVSQETLGTMMGKGQSDIAKIESGYRKVTFIEVLQWVNVLGYEKKQVLLMVNHFFPLVGNQNSLWKDQD